MPKLSSKFCPKKKTNDSNKSQPQSSSTPWEPTPQEVAEWTERMNHAQAAPTPRPSQAPAQQSAATTSTATGCASTSDSQVVGTSKDETKKDADTSQKRYSRLF